MKKRMLALLLLFCMVLGVGCSAVGDGIALTGAGGAGSAISGDKTTAAAGGMLTVASNGTSSYKIVYPNGCASSVLSACDQLAERINRATGATVAAVDGLTEKSSAKEIVLAVSGRLNKTNRDEPTKLTSKLSGQSGAAFVIEVVGEKIVLLASNETGLVSAINYLARRVLTLDAVGKTATIANDYALLFSGSTGAVEVLKQGEKELQFVIGPNTASETYCRLTFTGNHGWRIQTKNSEDDEFNDIGASQYLSVSLGEEPVNNTEKLTYATEGDTLTVTAPDGTQVKINKKTFSASFYTVKGTLATTVNSISSNEAGSSISGTLTSDEAIYGTGERFNAVNQRGKEIEMYSYDMWDKVNGSYMTIPLFNSSVGYGIFVNLYQYMIADLGNSDRNAWSMDVTGSTMDCYIFATEKIADSIYAYSALSGFADVPEEWTYGMLVCRYSPDFTTTDGVRLMISKMEEYGLPWTGVIMEGFGTYSGTSSSDWKKLCEEIHAMGKKVMCYIRAGDPAMRASGYQDAYLMLNGSGGNQIPVLPSGTTNPDSAGANAWYYLDVTNPEAVDWFFNTVWDMLANYVGIDGAKIDFCEELPDVSYKYNLYDETLDTTILHHWYPTYFCCLYWNKLSAKPDGGMCFTRGGGIGSQRNPFMWGGDQTRQYSRLQWQVRCLLSSGLSGVPFMSYDMSGYQYGNASQELQAESRVFIRGTEFTAFTINMQTHGKVRRSYDFAEEGDVTTTRIYQAYTKLHEMLTPYITEYSNIACETGMPVVRHLILKYQNDKNVYNIEDEYLFGDAFLVAPELNGALKRDIYLPQGKWKDMNTGEIYTVGASGMTLKNYTVNWSQLPVFYNMETDSVTAADVLPAIEEVFAYAKTLTY